MTKNRPKIDFQLKNGAHKQALLELAMLFARWPIPCLGALVGRIGSTCGPYCPRSRLEIVHKGAQTNKVKELHQPKNRAYKQALLKPAMLFARPPIPPFQTAFDRSGAAATHPALLSLPRPCLVTYQSLLSHTHYWIS